MVALADVYEVTFFSSNGNTSVVFTVPAKYAYAVVQAQFEKYVPDGFYASTYNGSISLGQTKFIVKGGRALKAIDFYHSAGGLSDAFVHLTIIGYLPT